MIVVHDIFHAMSKGKNHRLFWGIHITIKSHGKVLKIIACLNSGVHEATNAVIEVTTM